MLANEVRHDSGDLRFDLTGDGSLNLEDHSSWIHDIANTWIGDANLDGQIDSTDLIHVVSSGRYESDCSPIGPRATFQCRRSSDLRRPRSCTVRWGLRTGPTRWPYENQQGTCR